MNNNCPICSSVLKSSDIRTHTHVLSCPRCGEFKITDTARAILPDKLNEREIANASGWIRENPGKVISYNDVDFLKGLKTPNVPQKADKLLIFWSKQYPIPGQTFDVSLKDPCLLSVTWSQNVPELSFIMVDYLTKDRNYLSLESNDSIKITPAGWGYIDSLFQVNPESQIAFVAMWFDKRLDDLFLGAIHPAIESAGYEPLRIDLHQHNNRIDDEIIAMIRRSRFLVAELTGLRGGVYFEAGFALGMGLPVIWICDEKELENIHFDARQYNFITWGENGLDSFKEALQFRIERTLGRGSYKPGSSN
jgi:hypothetical protein